MQVVEESSTEKTARAGRKIMAIHSSHDNKTVLSYQLDRVRAAVAQFRTPGRQKTVTYLKVGKNKQVGILFCCYPLSGANQLTGDRKSSLPAIQRRRIEHTFLGATEEETGVVEAVEEAEAETEAKEEREAKGGEEGELGK